MRAFYLACGEIVQTPTAQLERELSPYTIPRHGPALRFVSQRLTNLKDTTLIQDLLPLPRVLIRTHYANRKKETFSETCLGK
jgi:hypothetical protein